MRGNAKDQVGKARVVIHMELGDPKFGPRVVILMSGSNENQREALVVILMSLYLYRI
jgi:hypothetical protein